MTHDIMTQEQEIKIAQLRAQGYIWDKKQSISAAGVVMVKGKYSWFFGLDGTILEIS